MSVDQKPTSTRMVFGEPFPEPCPGHAEKPPAVENMVEKEGQRTKDKIDYGHRIPRGLPRVLVSEEHHQIERNNAADDPCERVAERESQDHRKTRQGVQFLEHKSSPNSEQRPGRMACHHDNKQENRYGRGTHQRRTPDKLEPLAVLYSIEVGAHSCIKPTHGNLRLFH